MAMEGGDVMTRGGQGTDGGGGGRLRRRWGYDGDLHGGASRSRG